MWRQAWSSVLAVGLLVAGLLSGSPATAAGAAAYAYPPAPRGDVTDDYFGTTVPDPYRWLEDSSSAATQAWIDAESRLTRTYLDSLPSLAHRASQVSQLLDTTWWSAPSVAGGRTFWLQRPAGAAQSRLMWSGPGQRPTTLVDPSRISGAHPVSIGTWIPSPDGRFVAWGAQEGGSDWETITVVRVEDGTQVDDQVRWSRYTTPTWAKDSSGFAYNGYPPPANPLQGAAVNAELRFHRLGTPQSADTVLMRDPSQPTMWFGAADIGGEGYVTWATNASGATYAWVDSLRPDAVKQPLLTTSSYPFPTMMRIRGRSLWMLTTIDAPAGRVVRIDLDHPEQANWVTVVPEQADVLVGAADAGGRIILTYLHDSSSRMRIVGLDGSPGPSLQLPGIGTTGIVSAKADERIAYATYTSFAQPTLVLAIDSRTGKISTWRAPSLPFDPAGFTTTEAMIPSKDGSLVHAFIVRRTGVTRSGSNPTLLWGYGGFTIPLTPAYSPEMLAWVQTGGVLVQANLRGGGEFGDAWYRAGTQLRKQNTFDDFIAVAEWLKTRRWTDTAHLAISGRSNGGLLIGAVMTQRPDLAAVAIPQVGVLDMLRYHRFTIGANWARDYGRSDTSPEMFAALYAYSPVHNVRPGVRYPATMLTTAERDDRVVPAHSYKFAAALQQANAGTQPILIRIERSAGHGAGATRAQRVSQYADVLAFMDANLGISPLRPQPTFRATPEGAP